MRDFQFKVIVESKREFYDIINDLTEGLNKLQEKGDQTAVIILDIQEVDGGKLD